MPRRLSQFLLVSRPPIRPCKACKNNSGRCKACKAKESLAAERAAVGEHRALACRLRIIEGRWNRRVLQTGDEFVKATEAAIRQGGRLGREERHRSQPQPRTSQPDWFEANRAELKELIAERNAALAAHKWDPSEANSARLKAARASVQRAVRKASHDSEKGQARRTAAEQRRACKREMRSMHGARLPMRRVL